MVNQHLEVMVLLLVAIALMCAIFVARLMRKLLRTKYNEMTAILSGVFYLTPYYIPLYQRAIRLYTLMFKGTLGKLSIQIMNIVAVIFATVNVQIVFWTLTVAGVEVLKEWFKIIERIWQLVTVQESQEMTGNEKRRIGSKSSR